MFGSKRQGKKQTPSEVSVLQPIREIDSLPVELDQSLTISLAPGCMLKLGNAQHQGRRPYQEDSYGYSNLSDSALLAQKGVLAVLADGMGGLSNGKEVSTSVVHGMIEYFNAAGTICGCGADLFARAKQVNDAICRVFCPNGNVQAGSTLVCALLNGGRLHWLCIGDSRIYLYRGKMLYQINEDHDYLNQLLDGAIRNRDSVQTAFSDPQKDVLVQCIGSADLSNADTSSDGMELRPGDKILLCSDGVYNALPLPAINALMESPPQTAADNIAQAVVAQNIQSQDNLTIVVIQYN